MAEKVYRMTENLTDDRLKTFIEQHRANSVKYQELEDMYQGKHAILTAEDKPNHKPDNRIVANFAKYIVDTYNGYFIGKPLKMMVEGEKVYNYLQLLSAYNDLDDHNAELSKMTAIYGHAFELLFIDEDAQVGITTISPKECFLIKDNSIRERTLYGVRYTTNAEGETVGTISDDASIRYFVIKENKVTYTDEEPHYFGGVPIVEYVENKERQGVYENVETMINAYNKALSEKANDVDYFADAYMKILGEELADETLAKIRDFRIINLAGVNSEKIVVEFMEKPNADQTQENLIDRLERLIFELAMVPNPYSDKVGTTTGVALRYKLQNLRNMAINKERKFSNGLFKRFSLISNLPNTPITKDDVYEIEFIFSRNEPEDIQEEAKTAAALMGVVSDETALSTLSIVSDVKAEMERISKQTRNTNYDFELVGDERG